MSQNHCGNQAGFTVLASNRKNAPTRALRVIVDFPNESLLKILKLERLSYYLSFWNDAVFFDEGNYLLAPRHCIDGLAIRSSPNGLWSSLSFAAALRLPASLASPCRSEEHPSELKSLMRTSYPVFCLKKKKKLINLTNDTI